MSIQPYEHADGLWIESQGLMNPDYLAGPVYSRRFIFDGGDVAPYKVVTEYAAACIPPFQDEQPTPDQRAYEVQNVTETMWCSDLDDLGGSEVMSDMDTFEPGFALMNLADADKAARYLIETLSLEDYQ